MKLIVATWLLILSLVLSSSFLQYTAAESNPPKPAPAPPSTSVAPPSFCIPKCRVRCSKSGRAKRCMKYCYLCCRVCFCVPPGTYGNKQVCPCYANMKNDKGKPKCP